MAVIPQIVTSPGAVPGAPSAPSGGGVPRASSQMDVRAPSDPSAAQAAGAGLEAGALESTARSAEKMAQYGEQFAEKYVTAKLNIDAANRTADMSALLHQAEFESSKIADRDAATADFDGRAAKIRDDFAAQDVNPRVRAAVDASLPNQIALRRASTQQAAFGLWGKAQVGSLITNIDQYGKQAIDSADPRLVEQLIAQANAAIDGRVEGGALSAEVAAKMKVDFGSNVYMTKMEIAFQKDLASGLALYEATKGKLNAADARRMATKAADGGKQLQAEKIGNDATPPLGGYGNVSHWTGQIEGAAKKTGLPAPLIAAVASQESAGDPNAKSPAGAEGPMQFMPGTARDRGVTNVRDPNEAIPKGAEYLKEQIDKFGKVEGLMAYNWGPGNTQKWIDGGRKGAVPKETQDYVASVLRKEALFSGKGGDALAETNIEYLRNRERIARSDMDPELKARSIAVLDRNRGTMNAAVQEERKATKDAAETEMMKTALGKGTDGSFQQFADRYRAAGDNSEAEKWQWFADNESVVKNFYNATPAQQREIAAMAPGAAGTLLQSYLSNKRHDASEFRKLAVAEEALFNQGLASNADPETLVANAHRTIAYLKAAGEHKKAEDFQASFEGALQGAHLAKLPAHLRDQALQEARLIAQSPNGLTPFHNALLSELQKGKGKYDEQWNKDPMGMTDNLRITRTQPLMPNMTDEQRTGWALQRARDVEIARQHGGKDVPFLRPTEVAMLSDVLLKAKPEQRQQELARMAVALSAVPGAMESVAKQLHKNDVLSANFANAMGFYAKNTAYDKAIADSLIVAASGIVEAGPAGDKFKLPEKMINMIEREVDRSRGSGATRMNAAAIEGQNWAIAARYAYLAQGKRTDLNVIDEPTLQQAVRDVYGNIEKKNGKEWPIPREVNSSTWRQGIDNIDATDLANLMPANDGTRVTKDTIARDGGFQVVGDGKYHVYIPDPRNAGSEVQLRNADGRPFVIDIRQLIARGGAPVNSQDTDPARAALGVPTGPPPGPRPSPFNPVIPAPATP
jgi:soluble lytic murein transglycosylase-like protein